MASLIEIKEKYNIDTDKQSVPDTLGHFHNYLGVYEEIFNDVKDEAISILEIGVWKGESLKLWSEYFSKGEIYGIDIFERDSKKKVTKNISQFERINLYKVDSYKEDKKSIESRKQFFKSIKDLKFDIIIDDGAHTSESQIKTFNNFKHLLSDSGIYIIEDIRDWCSKHSWLECPHNPVNVTYNDKGELETVYLTHTKEKPWNDYSKCSDTHLHLVKKALPELKIIDCTPLANEGDYVPDNILGYYQKTNTEKLGEAK